MVLGWWVLGCNLGTAGAIYVAPVMDNSEEQAPPRCHSWFGSVRNRKSDWCCCELRLVFTFSPL